MKKNLITPNSVTTTCDAIKTAVIQSLKFTLLVTATMLVGGCSFFNVGNDEYACPGMPTGVQCMSAREVYSATNDGKVPRKIKESEEGKEVKTSNEEGSYEDDVVDKYVSPRLPDRPIPIRTPAEVMRIWIAPWEDTNGDLNVTGYLYTEIEARKWVIGDATPESEPTLKPLQTISTSTSNVQQVQEK